MVGFRFVRVWRLTTPFAFLFGSTASAAKLLEADGHRAVCEFTGNRGQDDDLKLGAGFAPMMLSNMPVIRELATFCLLAIFAALIGDLLLLPLLLYWFAPLQTRSLNR